MEEVETTTTKGEGEGGGLGTAGMAGAEAEGQAHFVSSEVFKVGKIFTNVVVMSVYEISKSGLT
jgi:hypothetical protein